MSVEADEIAKLQARVQQLEAELAAAKNGESEELVPVAAYDSVLVMMVQTAKCMIVGMP